MLPSRKTQAMLLGLALAASALRVVSRPSGQAGEWSQEDVRQRIRASAALVVVPVTVKDASGGVVHDVRREEFRVFEDGVEQEIQLFSDEPFPLSAVVLLDNGLPREAAQRVQRTAGAIAAGFTEFDEVAIGLFDTVYVPVADFSTDNDKIHDRLKRLELAGHFPGQGSAAMTSPPRVNTSPVEPKVPARGMRAERPSRNLDDAIYAAAQLLRARSRDRRKIIFLVSDGNNSRNNTFSFADTLKLLLSADISVYAIGLGDAALDRLGNPLARYGRATGGEVFYAVRLSELEGLYSSLTEQARYPYTLAYVPRNPDRSGNYHAIEVRVRRPNLIVLAREGYFATPPP